VQCRNPGNGKVGAEIVRQTKPQCLRRGGEHLESASTASDGRCHLHSSSPRCRGSSSRVATSSSRARWHGAIGIGPAATAAIGPRRHTRRGSSARVCGRRGRRVRGRPRCVRMDSCGAPPSSPRHRRDARREAVGRSCDSRAGGPVRRRFRRRLVSAEASAAWMLTRSPAQSSYQPAGQQRVPEAVSGIARGSKNVRGRCLAQATSRVRLHIKTAASSRGTPGTGPRPRPDDASPLFARRRANAQFSQCGRHQFLLRALGRGSDRVPRENALALGPIDDLAHVLLRLGRPSQDPAASG